MARYCGFKPADIDDLTMTQLDGYIENIPMLEYRAAYPMAAMMAHAGNLMGGRPKKPPKKSSDSTPYKPEEFLAWFAHYEPYLELTGRKGEAALGVDAETARLVTTLNTTLEDGTRGSRLEPWMVACLNPIWDEIIRVSGAE